jgi:dethiobiotin synthetase
VAGRLVIVTGTGTGIGKTHVSEALLRALSDSFRRVTGLKPVETGVGGSERSDRERLESASSFHVKQSGYLFAQPVSPHLAARESAQTIEAGVLQSTVDRVREQADLTLVELAGGLFTPLSPCMLNVDVVRSLHADFVLLVAPDRLGVLHDVLVATSAAASSGVTFSAIALVAPEVADSSTSRNMLELHMFLSNASIHELPRAAVSDLVTHPALLALAREILPV